MHEAFRDILRAPLSPSSHNRQVILPNAAANSRAHRYSAAYFKHHLQQLHPTTTIHNNDTSIKGTTFSKRKQASESSEDIQATLKRVAGAIRKSTMSMRRPVSLKDVVTFRFVLHPASYGKRAWDTLILLLVVYSAIVLPFDMAFRPTFVSLFDHVLDALFILDIVLHFRTAYIHDGRLVTNSYDIAQKYLHSSFLIDFLASFPVEALTYFNSSSWTRYVVLFRVLRLLRLGRIVRFLKKLPESFYQAWRIVRLFIAVLLCTHWTGCSFFTMLSIEKELFPDLETWDMQNDMAEADVFTRYTSSLYVGVLILIGEDIGPVTNVERLFSTASLLFGSAGHAILFGQVVILIQNLNKAKNGYIKKVELAETHMAQMQLPAPFRVRVQEYYDYCWTLNKCMSRDAFVDDLCPSLTCEFLVYFHTPILSACIFHKTSPDFLVHMVQLIIHQVYLKHDYIIKEGDVASGIYFIEQGFAYVGSQIHNVARIEKGSHFGQIGVLTNARCSASVNAGSNCSILMIPALAFTPLLQNFPKDAEIIFGNELKKGYVKSNLEKKALQRGLDHYSTIKENDMEPMVRDPELESVAERRGRR